jgi:ABC-2 type transport system ATP-binding protein
VLSVRLAHPTDVADASAVLASLAAGEQPHVDAADGEIRLTVADAAASAEAVRRLDARGLPILAVELQQPTLDDVFLALTGHETDESTGRSGTQEAA